MLEALKRLLKSNQHLHIFFMHVKNLLIKLKCRLISDETAIKRHFFKILHRPLDLENPKTFNEKIQWIKLYYRKNIMSRCADKYAVREHVRDVLGDEVLNELYAVYRDVDEIDLDALPDSFVMKVTHGSGQNLIVPDKKALNWPIEKKRLNLYMHSNHYLEGREWLYKNIPPRIICERYLQQNGHSPVDYKFYCFNGKVKFIQLDLDLFTDHKRNMYDTDWQLLPFELTYPNGDKSIKKPERLDEMLAYAEKLAQPFPFVRVDFYYLEGRIIFGEMTFHPTQGVGRFRPVSYDGYYGDMLVLPAKEQDME